MKKINRVYVNGHVEITADDDAPIIITTEHDITCSICTTDDRPTITFASTTICYECLKEEIGDCQDEHSREVSS